MDMQKLHPQIKDKINMRLKMSATNRNLILVGRRLY